MSDTRNKSPKPPSTPAKYSKELPDTRAERDRAAPEFIRDAEAKEQGPGPHPDAVPYNGERFNGTSDSSRFSTPPPKKSSRPPS